MTTDRSAALFPLSVPAARFGATRDDWKSSVEHTVSDQPFALIARPPASRGEA